MSAAMETLVARYVQVRDKIQEMEAEAKAKAAPLKDALARVEAHLLSEFRELGVESVKTAGGTAFVDTRTSHKVEDWDAALEFIQQNELWHLLYRNVSKAGVEEYLREHEALPPGVSITRAHTIKVHRPRGK